MPTARGESASDAVHVSRMGVRVNQATFTRGAAKVPRTSLLVISVHGNAIALQTRACNNLIKMENFYARSVFFVKDAEESLTFYTQTLGFALDWNHQYEGRAWVFQVSLFGFELILNQAYGPTQDRAGHGRVFIGLEDDQVPPLLQHIRERGLKTMRVEWGRPTLVLRDQDGNELFFWIPDSEWANLPPNLPTLDT